MFTDYPIERCCCHRIGRFQAAFARNAAELLSKDASIALERDGRGLLIAAETEMALVRPVQRLIDVYGDMVRIGPPTVRYRQGEHIEQPIMGVRVRCAPELYQVVQEDLQRRRAAIMDAELNRRFGVVRATAPLATMIGYPDRLAQMTDGHGQLVMWLSHYEHLDDPPTGDAA